jgi:hypothetical protein
MSDQQGHQAVNYIEVDGKPVEASSTLEWARWFESSDRQVALTRIEDRLVSTVFLGVDHSWGHGPPVLYETTVFSIDSNGVTINQEIDVARYCTREEALSGHDEMVKDVLKDKGLDKVPTYPPKADESTALGRYYNAVREVKENY